MGAVRRPKFVNEHPMGKASRRKKIPQSFVSTLPASLSNLPFASGCNPYGKISASLIDLIDPYADEDLPLDTMRKLVGMGVVAWNIASTSNTFDEATAELDRFIRDTPALGDTDFLEHEIAARVTVDVVDLLDAVAFGCVPFCDSL
jgi:hypothetical protein